MITPDQEDMIEKSYKGCSTLLYIIGGVIAVVGFFGNLFVMFIGAGLLLLAWYFHLRRNKTIKRILEKSDRL